MGSHRISVSKNPQAYSQANQFVGKFYIIGMCLDCKNMGMLS